MILPCESDPRDKEDALKVINACNLRKWKLTLLISTGIYLLK